MSWFCVDFVSIFLIVYYLFQLTLKMMLINGCVAWISCIKRSWVLPHLRSQRGMWTYFHFVKLNISLELKAENLKEIFKVQQAVPASYLKNNYSLVSVWYRKLMEILHVCFAIYMFWSCALLHPLMWTCNLPCFVYQTKNLLMRSQEHLV